MLRQIQPAVGCETFKQDFTKSAALGWPRVER